MISGRGDILPRQQLTVIGQFEEAFGVRLVEQLPNRSMADGDSVGEEACLADSRHDDDGERLRVRHQELRILRQEEDVLSAYAVAKLSIGNAAPLQGDHVIGGNAVGAQGTKQSEREVLVEKDLHDA